MEKLSAGQWTGLTAAVVVVLTLRAFGASLGWPLTDADAWANAAWAARPLGDQLLVPLTGGVAGDDAHFWRPAAMLWFFALRRLSGWAPAGWALASLVLHVVASVLAGALVRRGAGSRGGALLGFVVAVAFAAYPLTEDVVPATARSIDLLLAVATFAALLAASYLPGGGAAAWAGLLLAAAVALATKETAALLPGLAPLWVLLLGEGQGRRGTALRVAAALSGLVGAWLVLRTRVLGGVGGYYEAVPAAWVWSALERAFVEPFVPSLSAYCPRGWPTLVPLVATWLVLLRWGWRSPHRRLLIFAAAWFVATSAVHVATGTLSRRVYYVPTLPALLLVLPALVEGLRGRTSRPLALLLAGGWLAAFLHGSPAMRRYAQWPEVAAASEVYRDVSFWSRLPEGTRAWLLDRPFRADLDPRTFRFWGGRGRSLHHGAPAYAVEAWVREVLPGRGLSVETLTGTALRAPLHAQRVSVAVEGEVLVVRREGAERQRWPVRGPFGVAAEGNTLRVYAREPTTDVVVVWTPDGLVRWPALGEPGI